MTIFSPKIQIIAAILCATSFGLSISFLFPALTLRMEAMGYSGTLIGVHAAFAALASISIAPIMPSVVNYFGFAKTLRIFLVLGIFSIAAIGFSNNPLAWLIPRFLFSLAVTGIFILSESWINIIVNQAHRGKIIAIYAACLSIGFAAGPALLAYIGTNNIYIVPISLACMIPVFLAAIIAPKLIGELHKINLKSLVGFFKKFPLPLAAAFVFGVFETAAFTFMPLWGLKNGHSAENSALLISMMNIGIVAFQVPLGILADHFPKRIILMMCVGLICVFSAFLIFFAQELPLYTLYIVVFFWGGMAAALYTIGLVWLMEQLAPIQIVQGNSYFVWMYTIGMLIAPQIMGVLHDAAPHTGLLIGILTLLFLYFSALTLKTRNSPLDKGR